ncbi:MAG: fumarylacetoacetate hydrolase family protein [Chlorobi bacterium]|nr:fumarylacetoacetate hydrolase family protein [Chlorobiota bacterium]MCI0716859.1 fumarylacetoacetate hydrolase family protein [Chlorobiota bacterium]
MSKLRVKNSSDKITVQNVYCIGKNYLEHIKEFDAPEKSTELPKEPIIFLKPNSAVLTNSNIVRIPKFKGKKISDNLQNEIELVVVIGKDGVNIPETEAMDYVYGYAVGIDFTLRDIQTELKIKGLPWTLSKGFLTSAPVSEIVRKEDISNVENLNICLKINRETKQSANTSAMIFKISYIIYYLSSVFGLKKGDIIFTGTPAGITKLNTSDKIEAEIENIGKLNVVVE